MSRFVDECRKEWDRLGVPEAVSSEMAADLTADLAEAEAEGASPEDVLGNGVFDAKSFAASWATARGVVPLDGEARGRPRWPRWTVLVSAAVSLVAALVGLAILGGREATAVAATGFRRSLRIPPAFRIGPSPVHQLFIQGGSPAEPLGLILLLVGLVGLGLTLWFWRPWSTTRRRSGFDENVGLPSFL
jgi:hypothetical protein